jgi:ABC-type sulfate/molybdate transport systems ATPase subunit
MRLCKPARARIEHVSFLRIQNLYKTFDRVVAVNRINLDIKEGEFFTLLGSSGCGKTTTLRMVGGLEKPDGGPSILPTAVWFPMSKNSSSSRRNGIWAWCFNPMRCGRI